jgi:tRNA modification GTPase
MLEQHVELEGLPVVLQDTAGLRAGGDAVEAEGHRRALVAAQEADLVLLLWSVDAPGPPPEPPGGGAAVRISSRADLRDVKRPGWLRVSCRSGEGMEALRGALRSRIAIDVADLGGEVAIGARHRAALRAAQAQLESCDLEQPELAAESVRWALRAVEELVGSVGSEEVLDLVFASFCIGK